MAKVIVTADIDVPCGTPSLVRLYRASPEPVTAPRAHIAFIVAAGRGTAVEESPPDEPPPVVATVNRRRAR